MEPSELGYEIVSEETLDDSTFVPEVELDGEITVYESSLRFYPFKE